MIMIAQCKRPESALSRCEGCSGLRPGPGRSHPGRPTRISGSGDTGPTGAAGPAAARRRGPSPTPVGGRRGRSRRRPRVPGPSESSLSPAPSASEPRVTLRLSGSGRPGCLSPAQVASPGLRAGGGPGCQCLSRARPSRLSKWWPILGPAQTGCLSPAPSVGCWDRVISQHRDPTDVLLSE